MLTGEDVGVDVLAADVSVAIIAAVIVIGILWITRGTIDYYFGINLFPFVES